MKRLPYIEMWQSIRDGKWYYHVKSANGKIVADGSQGYASKYGAKRAAARVYPGLEIRYLHTW